MEKRNLSEEEKQELEIKLLKENERLVGIIVSLGIIGYLIAFAFPSINPIVATLSYMTVVLGAYTYWQARVSLYRRFIDIPRSWQIIGYIFVVAYLFGFGFFFGNHLLILVSLLYIMCGWEAIFWLIKHFYPKFFALYENYHTSDTD